MDAKLEEIKQNLTKLVHIRDQKKVSELTKYAGLPLEHKKVKVDIINNRQPTKQRKHLSRIGLKKIGLYSLPKTTLKYADYVPLNQLWSSYISEQFGGMDVEKKALTIGSLHYDQISQTILKSDYHGAKVKVIRSKCPSMVGAGGIVLLDTKHTWQVIGKDNKLRTIPKNDSVFEVKWNKLVITIFGKHLTQKPGERTTKKVKLITAMDI